MKQEENPLHKVRESLAATSLEIHFGKLATAHYLKVGLFRPAILSAGLPTVLAVVAELFLSAPI
jgi:hypothetical protein